MHQRTLKSVTDRLHRASESIGAHRLGKLDTGIIVWFQCEFWQEDSYLELLHPDGQRERVTDASEELQKAAIVLAEKRMQRALVA